MAKSHKNIFTTSLTERGYLATQAFHKVSSSYACEPAEPYLWYIASILYLYGGDFNGMYSGYKGKTDKNFEGVLGYTKEPWLLFTYRDKPLISKFNEVKIISEGIKQLGYDMWYPYNWVTKEGEEARSLIDPILEKGKFTTEMRAWTKKYEKLSKLADFWHSDFIKKYKTKHGLKFKLYGYKDDSYAAFTILDEKIKGLNAKEVKVRQEEYMKVFEAFAEYLYKGFLSKAKGFPKCIYEK